MDEYTQMPSALKSAPVMHIGCTSRAVLWVLQSRLAALIGTSFAPPLSHRYGDSGTWQPRPFNTRPAGHRISSLHEPMVALDRKHYVDALFRRRTVHDHWPAIDLEVDAVLRIKRRPAQLDVQCLTAALVADESSK